MRKIYSLGFLYIGMSLVYLMTGSGNEYVPVEPSITIEVGVPQVANVDPSDPQGWFRSIKAYCNPVEVDTRLTRHPAPESVEGTAYEAACFALAGRIDSARERILQLPEDARWGAAGVVFNVGHPVADAGDDLAAGPIMELVVEFWPNHYMALYHAGAARYALGDHVPAHRYLESFLRYYDQEDGWTHNARSMITEIKAQ